MINQKTIAIITAMQEEADIVIKNFSLEKVKSFQNFFIYNWVHNWVNIVLAKAWIWKTQAAIATTHILENYRIDEIINIWIAWNLKHEKFRIWDVFLINKSIQHDIYLPFKGEHLNYAKKAIILDKVVELDKDFNNFSVIKWWICLTWDQFVEDETTLNYLSSEFDWDIVEMELFSILSVAREYNVLDKCIAIKAISDGANNDSRSAHMNNLDFAMSNSVEVLKQIIK